MSSRWWFPFFALIGVTIAGCQSEPSAACADMSGCDSSLRMGGELFGISHEGRLDATAVQVWPRRPPPPAPLTAQELAAACTKLAACLPVGSGADYLSTCLSVNPYEERAIPYGSNFYFATAASSFLSTGGNASERWAFFARSVLDSAQTCEDINAILTARPREITCSEAGCWWYSTHLPIPVVTCEGDVAVLATDGSVFRRNCARAYLTCDTSSPTGCTDRPPLSCAPGAVDRCDGNIKLGCDAYGRVTYRDCGWIEDGRCIENDGGAACYNPLQG